MITNLANLQKSALARYPGSQISPLSWINTKQMSWINNFAHLLVSLQKSAFSKVHINVIIALLNLIKRNILKNILQQFMRKRLFICDTCLNLFGQESELKKTYWNTPWKRKFLWHLSCKILSKTWTWITHCNKSYRKKLI